MDPKHFLISARVEDDQFIDTKGNQINFYGTPEFGDSFIEGEKAIYTDASRYFKIKMPKSITDGEFTVYFWIKIIQNDLPNRWGRMMSTIDTNFHASSGGIEMIATSSGGYIATNYFCIVIDDVMYGKSSNFSFYTLNNTWTNYCICGKNGIASVYINGKKFIDAPYKNIKLNDYVGFAYYSDDDNVHRHVTGYWDDICIIDRCLFDGEFTPPNHYLCPDLYKLIDEEENVYGK